MQKFKTKSTLTAWADDHTGAEALAFYNALPGVKPIKRFEDRRSAVNRIWAALEGEGAAVATEAPADAPEAAKPAKEPTRAKAAKAPKARRIAKKAQAARTGTKLAQVLELVRRPGGVTLTEIMEATGWQKHSVRGFIAGALKTKLGLDVASTRDENGDRRYAVVSE